LAKCNESLTFAKDVAPLVVASGSGQCGACHSGRYDNKAGIADNRESVVKKVTSGDMPRGDSGWRDTTDGQTFLGWASCTSLK
jgi:hypothetical protein